MPRKPAPRHALVVHMTKDLNLAPPVRPPARCLSPPTPAGRYLPPDGLSIRTMDCSDEGLQRDVEAWLSIQNQAFRDRPRPWKRADFQRELHERNWFRPQHLWLAETPELAAPVGTIALELVSCTPALSNEPLGGRIHWLAVDPRFQRRGIGRTLVLRLEQECWERGAEQITLETLRSWTSVTGFYRSLGYQENHVISADP